VRIQPHPTGALLAIAYSWFAWTSFDPIRIWVGSPELLLDVVVFCCTSREEGGNLRVHDGVTAEVTLAQDHFVRRIKDQKV
jgi:hypothetical protein